MSIDKKKKTNKELRQQAEADALEDMEKPTRVKGPGFLNRLFAQQPVTKIA